MPLGRMPDAVEKSPPVAHAFDIHPNHARRRVRGHQVDIIRRFEHQHVADRRRLVHLDAVNRRLQTKIDGVGTALRNEAYVARFADFFFGKIPQPRARTVQPHAIWPDQRDFRIDREVAQLGFQPDSQLF